MALLNSYPFFGMSLALMAVCIVCMALFPSRRGPMFLSGLLCTPFCLYEVAFVPEYWRPVEIARCLVGLEDMMFSFATGGIAWLLGTCCLRRDISFSIEPLRFSRRFFGCSILGVILSLILWRMGLRIMTATLLVIAVGFIGLALRYRRLCSVAVPGALGFLLVYVAVLRLSFVIWPHSLLQWNSDGLWSSRFLGVPLEEVLWALAFGAIWPRFMAYVFDARLVVRQESKVGSGIRTSN